MKKNVLARLASSLLLVCAVAVPAMAADRDHDRDRNDDRPHYQQRGEQGHRDRGHDYRSRDDRGRYADNRRADYYGYGDYRRGAERQDYRERQGYRAPPRRVYAPPRRAVAYRPVPSPRWARGNRYYNAGYVPTYMVDDYGYYGLRQPPRGYYWRRSDVGDFLLVAVTTGIIADIILNH